MPSKKDSPEERRTDSWLFRIANQKDSFWMVVFWLSWLVGTSILLTLLAVRIFR